MKRLTCNHTIAHNVVDDSPEIAAFGFEPGRKQSPEFGSLYVVAQTPEPIKGFAKRIEKIAGQTFFEPGITSSLEDRFTSLLKHYNSLMSELGVELDIMVAAIDQTTLYYSFVGQPLAVLLHKPKVINLAGPDSHSPKRFSDITTTHIHSEDRLLIGTHSAQIQFTPPELANQLRDSTLEHFAQHFTAAYGKDRPGNFAALLVEAEEKQNLIQATKSQLKPGKLSKTFKKKQGEVITAVNKSTKITKEKVVPSVSKKTQQGWTHLWSRYINPYPKRAIIVGAVVVFIVIAIIVTWVNLSQVGNSTLSKYEKAQSLISQAQTNLKKNNNDTAQSQAQQAQTVINQLSDGDKKTIEEAAKTNKSISSVTTLQTKLTELLDELTDTTRVNLDSAYNLGNLKLPALMLINDNLYGVDSTNGQIVNINPLRKVPAQVAQSSDLANTISSATNYTNDGAVILTQGKIWAFSPPNSLQELKVNGGLPTSVAIASYLTNIYLLSPSENQVVRYSRSGTTLSNKTGILKNISEGSLAQATDLDVLGNVFVSSGQNILLFEGGNQRDFKISGLPADFGSINQMTFNEKGQYFVLLNQAHTRLALLSSASDSAEFKKQFAFADNQVIQSFTLAKDTPEAYVAAGGKLVIVSLDQ